MNNSRLIILIAIIMAILLGGCSFSLAEDVTPPPNAESYTSQTTPVATDSIFPIVPPDPDQGKEIYTEKCAACHGDKGMGDGPQASQLPVPVAALGDPLVAVQAKPADWFNIVTEGNLEKYMPGFRSLDGRQRWDVVAYALTLSMNSDDLSQGQVIYAEKCQSCHGESGQGSSEAPSWLEDATRLAQFSTIDIASIAASGINNMPAAGSDLDMEQLKNVALYTRALSFVDFNTQLAAAEPNTQLTTETTQAATPESAQVTFHGKVTNESGGELPDGLIVTLTGYDAMAKASEQQTPVKNGAYHFEPIEVAVGQTYLASIEYQGITFSSVVYHSPDAPTGSEVDLPIKFYDATSDTTPLRADRMHIFFDFSNPDTVQVLELFILDNTSNRVIVPAQEGAGAVAYGLPEGATNLQFADSALGERYIATGNGFTDTAPINPGTGQQLLFAYDLPYTRKMTLSIPIPMDVDAAIVMYPAGTITLKSDQLQSTGQTEVQGVSLELYTASGLVKDSILKMRLIGSGSSGVSFQLGKTGGMLIGAAALGLVLILVGYWLLRQRKVAANAAMQQSIPAKETAEGLMDAIIALDDRYKAGELTDEAYQTRREELKARLRSMMD